MHRRIPSNRRWLINNETCRREIAWDAPALEGWRTGIASLTLIRQYFGAWWQTHLAHEPITPGSLWGATNAWIALVNRHWFHQSSTMRVWRRLDTHLWVAAVFGAKRQISVHGSPDAEQAKAIALQEPVCS